MSLPAPALQHIFDLTVYVAAPIEAGNVNGLNSRGKRRIIPITGGTVTGHVQGKVLPGGADFQIVVSETTADLDARYMIELDNGEHILSKTVPCVVARQQILRNSCAASPCRLRRFIFAVFPLLKCRRQIWNG